MENFSEMTDSEKAAAAWSEFFDKMDLRPDGKKYRGRPRRVGRGEEKLLEVDGIVDGTNSRRTVINKALRQQALTKILTVQKTFPQDDLTWICDFKGIEAGGCRLRSTILYELGRITDNDQFVDAIFWLCQEKPKATDAVKILRRFRLAVIDENGQQDSIPAADPLGAETTENRQG